MAAIEDLIRQIAHPRLREQLACEVAKLKNQKKFGLVFEDHLPELLRLPKAAATVGTRVVRNDDKDNVTYRVTAEVNGKWIKAIPESGGPEEKLERLTVVVARAFGEPMYPVLTPVDAIEAPPASLGTYSSTPTTTMPCNCSYTGTRERWTLAGGAITLPAITSGAFWWNFRTSSSNLF